MNDNITQLFENSIYCAYDPDKNAFMTAAQMVLSFSARTMSSSGDCPCEQCIEAELYSVEHEQAPGTV